MVGFCYYDLNHLCKLSFYQSLRLPFLSVIGSLEHKTDFRISEGIKSLSQTDFFFFYKFIIILFFFSSQLNLWFGAYNVPIMLLVFKGDKVEEASDAMDGMRWVCSYFCLYYTRIK